MAAVCKMLCFIVLQVLFLNMVTAQINFQNIPLAQIKNAPFTQQPLISSLLSPYATSMPFVDKIGAIANVVQKMPAKPGRVTKRQYMAEALRKSAFESLMVAANACKCCGNKAEGTIPLPKAPMKVGGDVIGNRPVKVKYM